MRKKRVQLPEGYRMVPEGSAMLMFHQDGRMESVVPVRPDNTPVATGDPIWCVMIVSVLFSHPDMRDLFQEVVERAEVAVTKQLSKEGTDEQLSESVGGDRTPPGETVH